MRAALRRVTLDGLVNDAVDFDDDNGPAHGDDGLDDIEASNERRAGIAAQFAELVREQAAATRARLS